MNSMNRDRTYMENSIMAYRGVRELTRLYPWKSPHKLDPDFVHSDGGCEEMIRCFDVEFSTFQWWQVEFKILLYLSCIHE